MPFSTRYVFVVSMDEEALFNEVYDTEHVPLLGARATLGEGGLTVYVVRRLDEKLARALSVRGRVVDTAGKPVKGYVEYRAMATNPNLKAVPQLAEVRFPPRPLPFVQLDAEGRFTLPVLPGPGVLLVRAEGDYRTPRLAKEHRLTGVAHETDPTQATDKNKGWGEVITAAAARTPSSEESRQS